MGWTFSAHESDGRDLGIGRRIILRWMLCTWGVRKRTGFLWLSLGSSGWIL
jgi:hypothetical protein